MNKKILSSTFALALSVGAISIPGTSQAFIGAYVGPIGVGVGFHGPYGYDGPRYHPVRYTNGCCKVVRVYKPCCKVVSYGPYYNYRPKTVAWGCGCR